MTWQKPHFTNIHYSILNIQNSTTMESHNNYSDEEIISIVQSMRDTEDDMPAYMDHYYEELLFIGCASHHNKTLLSATLFGIRVCIEYYLDEQDYSRVARLQEMKKFILNHQRVEIDEYIIESIECCMN